MTRVLTAPAATVRGDRVEQQVTVMSANEVYVIVRPSRQPPMRRWQYLRGEVVDLISIKQGTAYNLSGPMPLSAGGPLEVTARAIEGATQ